MRARRRCRRSARRRPAGEVRGGIPAGCVESAVLDAAAEALRTGRSRLARYAVGGGRSLAVPARLCRDAVGAGAAGRAGGPGGPGARRPRRRRTGRRRHRHRWSGPVRRPAGDPAGRLDGTLGDPVLDDWVAGQAVDLLRAGGTAMLRRPGRPPVRVLLQGFPAVPRMLLFGATAVAGALSRIGVSLGYRVTVCDPRPAFVSAGRFPYAHEVHRAWPHRWLPTAAVDATTVLCLLGHDPRYELPLLRAALDTPAGYIGVLGSRAAHAARIARLRADGMSEERLSRLVAPAGLDLNGRRRGRDRAVDRGRTGRSPARR
ncbi:XdhC family protein [Micromonospora sp. ATA32]|nr:XdhC family protein [Micromonospora sp. ATA32]